MKKKLLIGILVVVAVVVVLSLLRGEEPRLMDPPLSNAPYELIGPSFPRGERILAMAVTMAEDGDYEKAFGIAKSIGIQAITLSQDWKDIETAPGKYGSDPNFLAIANTYYPAQNTLVALDIRPIHTNRLAVPSDLENTPFDDPVMIERFNKMIDYVFSQIPDVELAALYIGSEFDVYMQWVVNNDPKAWKQYETFYKETRAHIKSKYPNLKVGAEATFWGLTGEATKEHLKRLNRHSDIIGVSYYHVDQNNFKVPDPKEIHSAFKEITALYSGRPIYFHQFGAPYGATLNSSEVKQREFIREAFKAWDTHASQVQLIAFTWLTDASPEDLALYQQYYGLSDRNFVEYLRTLGFRTYPGSGADRESLRALKAEAKARGW